MPNKFLKAIFAGDDEDVGSSAGRADGAPAVPENRPRSLADAWERLAESNRKIEERLASLDAAERARNELLDGLRETSKQQLDVLHVLGKFHEAAEKRGREMENQLRGVPDVLRGLPTATREQAERLSEIAARLYEKAQDNTVSALKSAQANHQRTVEDLIDKSLGASRRLTVWAMLLVLLALALVVFAWLQNPA